MHSTQRGHDFPYANYNIGEERADKTMKTLIHYVQYLKECARRNATSILAHHESEINTKGAGD